MTRRSLRPLTIGIILTALCVKSWGTDQITWANQAPSLNNPELISQRLIDFRSPISRLTQRICDGTLISVRSFERLVNLLHSQDGDGTFLVVETQMTHSERQWLMIPNVLSPRL